MKIFVGHLHTDASETQLIKLFKKFGEVSAVTIVMNPRTNQSRGYGFVEMEEGNAGLKAIEQLNNKNFMNELLEVSEAVNWSAKW